MFPGDEVTVFVYAVCVHVCIQMKPVWADLWGEVVADGGVNSGVSVSRWGNKAL